MAQNDEHYGLQWASATSNSITQNITEHAEKSSTGGLVTADPWSEIRRFTRARIALGRVGTSLPTKEILDFSLSHAMARDAVHLQLDTDALEANILSQGYSSLRVHSMAPDRHTYLLRPDFGRRLNDDSRQHLLSFKSSTPIDFLIVVGDGLSSLAIQRHVVPMLGELKKCIPDSWHVGPVVIAKQARVALADEVGEIMGARMVAILIGERPGLSSPDSLGIYLTYAPRIDCSDADRNCISNIRPQGLQYAAAAQKLIWLAKEAMQRKISGISLKDGSEVSKIELGEINLQ